MALLFLRLKAGKCGLTASAAGAVTGGELEAAASCLFITLISTSSDDVASFRLQIKERAGLTAVTTRNTAARIIERVLSADSCYNRADSAFLCHERRGYTTYIVERISSVAERQTQRT